MYRTKPSRQVEWEGSLNLSLTPPILHLLDSKNDKNICKKIFLSKISDVNCVCVKSSSNSVILKLDCRWIKFLLINIYETLFKTHLLLYIKMDVHIRVYG